MRIQTSVVDINFRDTKLKNMSSPNQEIPPTPEKASVEEVNKTLTLVDNIIQDMETNISVETPHDSDGNTTTSSITISTDKDTVICDQKQLIADLNVKLYTLARLLSTQTGKEVFTIEALIDENENQKLLLKSKDLTLAYWSELNLTVNSFTSKKCRLKQIQKERKFDRRTLRDVMQMHIFPFMKFCPTNLMHSLNEGSIALVIMKKLNIEESKWAPWWARNQELAEGLLVEHRTSSSQNMKISFNKGMCRQSYPILFRPKTTMTLTTLSKSVSPP